MPTQADQPTQSRRRSRAGLIMLWALVLVLAAGLGYMIWQNQNLKKPESQNKLAEQASQAIIDEVENLIIVPDERPTVATITDIDTLREANQSFYKDAKNGDSLLLYSTQAIIYRSEDNLIVNVAPVVINPETTKEATDEVSGGKQDETTNTPQDTDGE